MNHQVLVKMKENNDFSESKAKPTPVAMVAPEMKQNSDADTEISKTCAVLGCDDRKNIDADSFFRFPEETNLRQIWTDLTGRSNWTPTDYSYICSQHFSIDCFSCDEEGNVVLSDKAVPSLKLPRHVLEVEYIEDEAFEDNEEESDEMESDEEFEQTTDQYKLVNGNIPQNTNGTSNVSNVDLLKLFSDVQRMQRQVVSLRDKIKQNMKIHNKQNNILKKHKALIEVKKKVLSEKRKKKSRILLSLQEKINEDANGLVLAMPTRYTDELKNFSLSLYKHSPQAYIYIRNSLRTMLPSTDIMDNWINAGHQPKNVMGNNNLIKVVTEHTDTEMTCKISLR